MRRITLAISCIILTFISVSQEVTNDSIPYREDAVSVYVNCYECDANYLRETINYVNFVRERLVAEVSIRALSEPTANDGELFTLEFEGLGRFKGRNDTLEVNTDPDISWRERREELARVIQLGLAPYVAKTKYGSHISVNFETESEDEEPVDKWNKWVFNLNLHGYLSGQASYRSLDIYSGFRAEKITEKLKTEFSMYNSYSENQYTLEDYNYTAFSRNNGLSHSLVGAISDHWSFGYSISLGNSVYSNKDLSIGLVPAIEFNVYPYSEAIHQQFRMRYSIGPMYNDYHEITIYDKTEEMLYEQMLLLAYKLDKNWGNISLNSNIGSYMHDLSKNYLSLYGSASIRVFKGFSVSTSLSYTFVHNQVALPKGGLSPEEILLQLKQSETSYSYSMIFGVSYTFGSIYNTVVNPRFGYW